jgi:hypothetical protein
MIGTKEGDAIEVVDASLKTTSDEGLIESEESEALDHALLSTTPEELINRNEQTCQRSSP